MRLRWPVPLAAASMFASLTACGAAEVRSHASASHEHGEVDGASGAVAARLAPMPAPPVPWDTPIARLSDADFEGICPYLAQNAGLSRPEVHCADGRVVEPYAYHCEPSTSGPSARSMPCSITFGEILACYLALREHPCEAGETGEGLAECAAFAACGVDLPGSPS